MSGDDKAEVWIQAEPLGDRTRNFIRYLRPGGQEAEVRLTTATDRIVVELWCEIGDPVCNRRAATERDNYKLACCVGYDVSSNIADTSALESA